MSTPLSFCDISARFGQSPAPQQSIEEQTGWNPRQLFLDYLQKVREQREENAKHAEEDALMAMIDAMNASEEDKESGKADQEAAEALAKAGAAIVDQATEFMEDGSKRVTWVDPMQTLTVQAMMACLDGRFTFEQADKLQENRNKAREDQRQEAGEERLEVTEAREPSDTIDPDSI